MSERFYHPGICHSESVSIVGPEANHITNVMRLTAGQHIHVFDGEGLEFVCEIVESTKKEVKLKKIEPTHMDLELPFKLHIGVALPKSDRQKFLVEKLTELGVTELTPINSRRSVAKGTSTNISRFKRYVIEASKQCGRNQLMQINSPSSLSDFVHAQEFCADLNWTRLIATPSDSTSLPRRNSSNIVAAIGPEGGFADLEIEEAVRAGFCKSSLGDRILRTETAAIALASYYCFEN